MTMTNVDMKELEEFLKAAHTAEYENAGSLEVKSRRRDTQTYDFELGKFKYRDISAGFRDFIGIQIIYQAGDPVWGMNYRGTIPKDGISAEEVRAILLDAFLERCRDILPVRGPKSFQSGAGLYSNNLAGKIDRFLGTETISVNQKMVYEGSYTGGLLR